MPSLVIPAGYALAAYRFSLEGDSEEMIFTLGVDVGGIGDADTLAAGLATAWHNEFGDDDMSELYTFVGVDVRYGPYPGVGPQGSAIANEVGTNALNPPPQNVALLIHKNTGLGGRQNRGRMYWPPFGLSEGDVGPTGIVSASLVTSTNTKLSSWLGDLDATGLGGVTAVLLHSDPSDEPTEITSLTLDGRVATQRRRLRR